MVKLEVCHGDLQANGEDGSDFFEESLTISELLLAQGPPCWGDEAETRLLDCDHPELAIQSGGKVWIFPGKKSHELVCRYMDEEEGSHLPMRESSKGL